MASWQGFKDASGITDVENFGKGLAKGVQDLTGASKITKALNGATQSSNNGHTTSGMDQALQDHADQQHPLGGR